MWRHLFERKRVSPDMPAIWPAGSVRWMHEYWQAWCWRRRMRQLLEAERKGRFRLGSERAQVLEGAAASLRHLRARRRVR